MLLKEMNEDVEGNLIGEWEWLIHEIMFLGMMWILTLKRESTKSKVDELRNLNNETRRLI